MRRVNASGICRQGSWRSGVLEKDAHRSTIISRDGSPGYILFFVLWAYVGIVYGILFDERIPARHMPCSQVNRLARLRDLKVPASAKVSRVPRPTRPSHEIHENKTQIKDLRGGHNQNNPARYGYSDPATMENIVSGQIRFLEIVEPLALLI